MAQLPQAHDYQVTLRNYLASITLAELDVTLTPVTYDDGYLTTNDELHAAWIVLEDIGRAPSVDMSGLRVASSHFALSQMERDGQVYMRVGRNSSFMDPINTAWWAAWDYAGNPYYGSSAVKKRAFVAAAVDLMMTDQDLELSTDHRRSDFVGGYLTKFAYVYYVVKDILPADVQAAYETGLIKIFERLETYPPYGAGGADMESMQLPGLWYAGEAVASEDLKTRALDRARTVLEQIMAPSGYYHHHGQDGIDLSYEGISQHFFSWAALLFDDAVIDTYVEQSAKLKAFQTLPEPSGHFYSPSHFNTGTIKGAAQDQWHTYQRDHAMAMRTDQAQYLIWSGRALPAWYFHGLPSTDKMRTDIAYAIQQRNADADASGTWAWMQPSDKAPGIWQAEHWIQGIPAAGSYYPDGFYDAMASLEAAGAEETKPPFLQSEGFVEVFEDQFVIARFEDYGAILHTGSTVTDWGEGVPGLSGGALSAFWTPEAGSVILGRSRGTQNAVTDEWSGEQGWESWAVHAISGENASGQAFSSARNRKPTVATTLNGIESADVQISGAIGLHDEGRSAPDGAITGQVDYDRRFILDAAGLSITSTITSDETDEISALWEMIPLFLMDTEQGVNEAVVEFYVDDTWVAGNTNLIENVSAVRTTRFDQAVEIIFDSPQRAKLSSKRWTSTSVGSQIQNLMVDLSGITSGTRVMPALATVQYTIRVAGSFVAGDASGDGVVSAYDAATVLHHITDQELSVLDNEAAADASGDGTITAFDASLILQYLVGLIDCMPADVFCPAN